MNKFQYTAINQQNKTLQGIVEAQDIELARKSISNLKLTLVDLKPLDYSITDSQQHLKYKFEALNNKNQKIKGTISSNTIFNAFKKLTTEYELTVKKIASINSDQEEFDASETKIPQLISQLEQTSATQKSDKSIEEVKSNNNKQNTNKYIKEVLNEIKKILSNDKVQLSETQIEFFKKYQEHIIRIQNSENYQAIKNACTKVLQQLESLNLGLEEQTQFLKLKKQINNEQDSLFSIYLQLLFTTKSTSLRKEILKTLIPNLKKIFKLSFNTKYKKNLEPLTGALLLFFGSYYFVSAFISQKINKIDIHPIFNIYNTKIILYIILLIFLLHTAIIFSKLTKTKIIYFLYTIFYVLIILNL